MAKVESQGLWRKLFPAKEKDPYAETRKGQEIQKKNAANADNLIAKLNAIDFYSKNNGLSQEIIKEENYEGIRTAAINLLKAPIVITRDISALDAYLDQAVVALNDAVVEGLPTAAEWAAAALYQGLTQLRKEVSDIDRPYADSFYKQQLEYAANLEIIIKESLLMDRKNKALAREQTRFIQSLEELAEMEERIENLKRTPEGISALAEIRQHVNQPMLISDAAKPVYNDLINMHIQMADTKQREIDIYVSEKEIQEALANISSARIRLTNLPVPKDPLMQEKMNQALETYRDNMVRTLNDISESRKARDNHISQMISISRHDVFRDDAARAIQVLDRLEQQRREEINRKRLQLELMQKEAIHRKQEAELLNIINKEIEDLYNSIVNTFHNENPIFVDNQEIDHDVEYEIDPE